MKISLLYIHSFFTKLLWKAEYHNFENTEFDHYIGDANNFENIEIGHSIGDVNNFENIKIGHNMWFFLECYFCLYLSFFKIGIYQP